MVRADTLPLVFPVLGAQNLPRGARLRVQLGAIDEISLDLHGTVLERLDSGEIAFDRLVIECTGLADPAPVAQTFFIDEELRERLAIAISILPDRLQLIVQLYFLEELNLSEIAETIGVSIPRVHQLKAQAIDRLRAALAGVADII